MAFTMIVSRFEKKSLPTKLLSFFALIAQPLQNVANRSDCQIIGTDKKAYPTCILNPVSLLWSWHFKHGVYATSFPFP